MGYLEEYKRGLQAMDDFDLLDAVVEAAGGDLYGGQFSNDGLSRLKAAVDEMRRRLLAWRGRETEAVRLRAAVDELRERLSAWERRETGAGPIPAEKPDWWPECPYPEEFFPGLGEAYAKAVPDPALRTRLSGVLGRWFWRIATEAVWDRLVQAAAEGRIRFNEPIGGGR